MTETKKRATARKPSAAKKPTLRRKRPAAPTFEQIQLRAYELFVAGELGDEVEHWLRAERELATA
jgi:hypothetical protein